MDEMKHRRLQELDRSDFEIVDGEPDIRGWDVKNSAGLKIGEVEELIVDAQQKKVRYMVVDLDDKDLKLPDRKVLVPIGLAELHDKDDDVILPAITVDQLGALPAYDKDSLDDEVERKVCLALGRTEHSASTILQATGDVPQATHTPVQPATTTTERQEEETQRPVMQPASQSSQKSSDTTPQHSEEPPLGTAEYYGNFYQHAFFNDYNLYRNRQQQAGASATSGESEYERGLQLWEQRYQDSGDEGDSTPRQSRERNMSEERRLEMVRDRRRSYEERRSHSGDHHHDDEQNQQHRRDNTIIGRIRDEGLQDG